MLRTYNCIVRPGVNGVAIFTGVAGRVAINVPYTLVLGFVYILALLGCRSPHLGLASFGW